MSDQPGEFASALAATSREAPRLRASALALRIGDLRHLAKGEGLAAAVELTDALVAALGREARATPIGPWLAAIDQAAQFGPAHPSAAPLLLATVGVHLA